MVQCNWETRRAMGGLSHDDVESKWDTHKRDTDVILKQNLVKAIVTSFWPDLTCPLRGCWHPTTHTNGFCLVKHMVCLAQQHTQAYFLPGLGFNWAALGCKSILLPLPLRKETLPNIHILYAHGDLYCLLMNWLIWITISRNFDWKRWKPRHVARGKRKDIKRQMCKTSKVFLFGWYPVDE